MKDFVTETQREIPVIARPDVLVVGGGAAGTAAAVAAAREGLEVLLVDRYGFLGGTLTAVTLGSFCGPFTVMDEGIARIVGGVYLEVEDRLRKAGGAGGPRHVGKIATLPYDPPTLRLICDQLVADNGVKVLFHALASAVVTDDRKISAVMLETKGGRKAVVPRAVIDCSGDGDIAALAGCEYELGDGGITQFGSSMFRLCGVDTDKCGSLSREELRSCLETAVSDGYDIPRTAAAMYVHPLPGIVHLNTTRVADKQGEPFNLIDPFQLTEAEIEGRRQAYLYEEVYRKYVPGFEDARIVELGAQIGIRETRLLKGRARLDRGMIDGCVKPSDMIACNSWPIEVHSKGAQTRWEFMQDGEFYGIPYGCLVPRELDNLWVAGRNISATHEAQASVRVSSPCYALGQAAGIAAAMALGSNISNDMVPVTGLQSKLRGAGAILDGPVEALSS